MSHNAVIFPVLVPLVAGILMIFLQRSRMWQRWVSMTAATVLVIISVSLVKTVHTDGILSLNMGGWPAPFGITLVADMLSALLVLASSIVCLTCLIYAFGAIGEKHERHYLYPFLMFLVCGVHGSFLTGDAFNLFVFFEVMLISSYVLLSLGGQRVQLRESLKYVVINMVASTLFVVAIAYLYSIAGTLNMAHLSERVATAGQDGLLTTVSLLFFVVFATKAALFLFVWLPGSYSAAPAPIAAIFAALLTKVGIYAILRFFTLIFPHQPQVTHTVMIWLGAATMVLGALGAVSHWGIRRILAYNVIVSVGFIVFAIGMAGADSLAGALYYLLHDMIAKALLFILGGTIISIAGTDRLRDIAGLIRYRPLLGWLFFLTVLSIAGIPPLSGFVGKVMILEAGVHHGQYVVAAVGLLSSLLVLYSLMKVFIQSFWGETFLTESEAFFTGKGFHAPALVLAFLTVAMGLGADRVLPYIDAAVNVMTNPELYIRAVLKLE